MNKLFIALIIAAIITMVGFVIDGIVSATTQESKLEDSLIKLILHSQRDKRLLSLGWKQMIPRRAATLQSLVLTVKISGRSLSYLSDNP